jgi:glucose/arabinose dehydrogenase/PKD repeat protein
MSLRVSRGIHLLAIAALAAAAACSQESDSLQPTIQAITLPAQFTDSLVAKVGSPTAMAFTPDHRLLITAQTGAVRVVKNNALLGAAALNLSSTICTNSERGVLGVAVDPDWSSNHFVFLYYTFKRGNCNTNDPTNGPRNRVSRFVYDTANDTLGGEVVIVDNILSLGGNHNGGDIHFGGDGYLYISVGDSGCQLNNSSACGGGNTNARNKNIVSGKILRVKRDGSIPSDNPWVSSPGARRCAQPGTDPMYALASDKPCVETYAWGLRNPFRFAFDPTGAFFNIDDVGQNVSEEIDRGAKGANFGWPTREGYCANGASCSGPGTPPAGMTNPIFAWDRNAGGVTGGCKSITGGAFVPGGVFGSGFDGAYLFSDYVCGKIFKLTTSGAVSVFGSARGGSSAVAMMFGPDPTGGTSLYYTTYASGGEVHRVKFTGNANRAPTARVTASPTSGPAPLVVTLDGSTSSDPDGDAIASYRWDFGDGSAVSTTTSATTTHSYAAGDFNARLTVTDSRGLASTSAAQVAISAGNTPPTIRITSPAASKLFAVGEHITLTAAASDAEDGTLAGASITWNVLRHHAEHTHPWFSGTGASVVIDGAAPEDLAAAMSSYLEIQVTATDSDGLSTTVSQDLNPRKVNLTFASSPNGMRLELDTTTIIQAMQTVVVSWQGWGLRVNAPAQAGQVWASWSDGGAADHVLTTPANATTYTATFVAGTPGFAAKVSFRPAASAVPAGYVGDAGAAYGARGGGLTYGWNGDNSAATRERNSAASPDELRDGLIHLQKPELPNAQWEIAVPNGTYDVHVVSGDPDHFDSVFRTNVEGVPVVSGTPTTGHRYVEGTATVTVNDGKLTLSNGSGASNNKLNFVELTKR